MRLPWSTQGYTVLEYRVRHKQRIALAHGLPMGHPLVCHRAPTDLKCCLVGFPVPAHGLFIGNSQVTHDRRRAGPYFAHGPPMFSRFGPWVVRESSLVHQWVESAPAWVGHGSLKVWFHWPTRCPWVARGSPTSHKRTINFDPCVTHGPLMGFDYQPIDRSMGFAMGQPRTSHGPRLLPRASPIIPPLEPWVAQGSPVDVPRVSHGFPVDLSLYFHGSLVGRPWVSHRSTVNGGMSNGAAIGGPGKHI